MHCACILYSMKQGHFRRFGGYFEAIWGVFLISQAIFIAFFVILEGFGGFQVPLWLVIECGLQVGGDLQCTVACKFEQFVPGSRGKATAAYCKVDFDGTKLRSNFKIVFLKNSGKNLANCPKSSNFKTESETVTIILRYFIGYCW